ncbi:hypothetical protein [Aliterella atlantica]|uniref:hypothetical protein n=1 Tax=Aliterella atlantica TaxID=1827278 RepID=UPI001186F2BA|nr:hypothetical protein [Aliterella atlantica]
MKFICTLPEQKHYQPVQSTTPEQYIWVDKASNLIRIVAPVPDPWKRKWVVLPTINRSKNDTERYPNKLSLRCFALDESNQDAPKGSIEREVMHGKFTHSQNSPVLFYSFPLEENKKTYGHSIIQQWLVYAFFEL